MRQTLNPVVAKVLKSLHVDTHKRISAGAISGEEVSYLLANRADPAHIPEEAYAPMSGPPSVSLVLRRAQR
jgi:hypothetical protein